MFIIHNYRSRHQIVSAPSRRGRCACDWNCVLPCAKRLTRMYERRYKVRRAERRKDSRPWHASCWQGQAGIIHRHKGWEKQDKEIRRLLTCLRSWAFAGRCRVSIRKGRWSANECQTNVCRTCRKVCTAGRSASLHWGACDAGAGRQPRGFFLSNESSGLRTVGIYHGEFDPGSERTLAACLKHASRAASAAMRLERRTGE